MLAVAVVVVQPPVQLVALGELEAGVTEPMQAPLPQQGQQTRAVVVAVVATRVVT